MNGFYVSLWREKISRRGFNLSLFAILSAVLIISGFFIFEALALTGITVTSPDGGEYWNGEQDITWTSDCVAGDTVNIYYSTDNFTGISVKIANAEPCENSPYSWNTTGTVDSTSYNIKVRDTLDVDVFEVSGTFTVDNTEPEKVTDLVSTSHAVSTWDDDKTVDFSWTSAVDATSGLDGYSVVCDAVVDTLPDDTKNIEETETTYICSFSDGDSNYIHIRSVDNAGNWDDEAEHLGPFFIDTQDPTTSDDAPTGWQTESVTITLTTSDPDPTSGLAWTKYCTDTENTCDPAGGTDYTVPVEVSTEGTSYFIYASQDNAGNVQETVSKTIEIDTIAPTFNIIDGVDPESVQIDTINVTITEENSGVVTSEYGFSDDDVCDESDTYGNGFTSGVNFDVAGDHTDYLCVTATDAAGKTGYDLVGQLNTDNTEPSILIYTLNRIEFSPNGDGIEDDVTIDLEFSETVDYDIYIKDGGDTTVKSWSGTAQSPDPKTWDGTGNTGDGIYTIEVLIEDDAGNTYRDTTETITIDTTTIYAGGSSLYVTIGSAITAANSGDTIEVEAGTYTESLAINKGVTLQGAGREVVTVTGTHTITANNVVIDGFTLDANNANFAVITIDDTAGIINGGTISDNKIFNSNLDGIRIGMSGSGNGVNNITIEDNEITANTRKGILFYNGGDYEAQAISDITISGNNITFNGSSGISTYGPGPNTITGNTVTDNAGNGISIKYDDGDVITGNTVAGNDAMGINMHQVTNTLVENNTVSGHLSEDVVTTFWGGSITAGKGSAIYVHEASQNNTIRLNDLTDNKIGVLISREAAGDDPSGNSINNNEIAGNIEYGILNALVDPATLVDAEDNWWGSANGPEHSSNTYNIGSQGDEVSDNVDFITWLDAAVDGNSFAPVVNSNTNEKFASIQAAIDDSDTLNGHTINVAAGTYAAVTLNKSLTLQGPNAGISPITGTRVAEAVLTGSAPLIELSSGAVNIEGFTFQDATGAGGIGGVILADGASDGWGNVTIRSNRFINNYGPAIGVWTSLEAVDPANWTITDNLIDGVTGSTRSGIYLDLVTDLPTGFSGWEISFNTIKHTEYGGIMVHGAVDMVISENIIEDIQKTGIQSSGIYGDVRITDNVITRAMLAQAEPFRAGIRLYGTDPLDEYGPSQLIRPVWVTNNTITDSYIGFATKSGHDFTAHEVHVNGNRFTGNSEAGLRHGGTGLLDATNNWWGNENGPTHTSNTGGTGDAVSDNDNVDYRPWCTEGTCTDIDGTSPTVTVDSLFTNDSTPTLTGTVTDDNDITEVEITITVDGEEYSATNDGDGTWTLIDNIITSALVDGTYDVGATAEDMAGNIGTDATTNELEIDATPPEITALLAIVPNFGTLKIGDTITLNITADAAGYTASAITVNGVDVAGSFTDLGMGSYSATYVIEEGDADVAEGVITASVVLVDAADNTNDAYTTVGVNTLTIDANTPIITSITSDATEAGWLKVDDTINFTLTLSNAEPSAIVSGSYNDVVLSWTTDDGGLTYTAIYTVTEGGTDQLLTLLQITGVIMTDEAGNIGDAADGTDVNKTIDANSPEANLLSTFVGLTLTGGDIYPVSWTASDGNFGGTPITLEYSVDGGGNWTTIANIGNTSPYSWIVPTINSSGAKVKVTAVDLAGNATESAGGEFAISYFETVDTTDPVVTVNSPNGGESLEGGSIYVITWTATDDNFDANPITLEYSINGGEDWIEIEDVLENDGAYSWTVPDNPSTNALVKITATDSSNNPGFDISNAVFTITEQPPAKICDDNGDGTWTCDISLSIGWNLISLPLIPGSPTTIEDVLTGIISNVDIVWYYDAGSWLSYTPGEGGPLTTMEDGKGYWIFMNSADVLIVTGVEMPEFPNPAPTYEVIQEWNLIGFKSTSARTLSSTYLESLTGSYILVDENNINRNDDYMYSGKGYWLWMNQIGNIVTFEEE